MGSSRTIHSIHLGQWHLDSPSRDLVWTFLCPLDAIFRANSCRQSGLASMNSQDAHEAPGPNSQEGRSTELLVAKAEIYMTDYQAFNEEPFVPCRLAARWWATRTLMIPDGNRPVVAAWKTSTMSTAIMLRNIMSDWRDRVGRVLQNSKVDKLSRLPTRNPQFQRRVPSPVLFSAAGS